MKRIMQAKNKVTLLLLSAILLLCIGFIFTACGVGPVTKAVNTNRGAYAVDFVTNCPAGRVCTATATATEKAYAQNSIQGKPLTLEAWIKPKATTTAFILNHIFNKGAGLKTVAIPPSASCDGGSPQVFTYGMAHGAVLGQALVTADTLAACGISPGTYYVCTVPTAFTLTLDDTSAACALPVNTGAGVATAIDWSGNATVSPMFQIRRSVVSAAPGATSSVSYVAVGTPIALNTWTHVAGKLTNDVHAIGQLMPDGDGSTTAHPTCVPTEGDGDATDDVWHLDIYLNGIITACAPTYGGNTDYTGGGPEADPTAAGVAYADEPGAKLVNIYAQGIVDETRIWTTDDRVIMTCMRSELFTSGYCNYTLPTALSYIRFNAGAGHTDADVAGVFGLVGLEYAVGNDVFKSFETGWTLDTPF